MGKKVKTQKIKDKQTDKKEIEKTINEIKDIRQDKKRVFIGEILCVGCNTIKKVRKDVYNKRIEKYGSEDELLKKYLCRKCRKK